MIRYLGSLLFVPGMLFGFTVTKDTLYSPSLTTNPAYTSAQLMPSKSALKEIIDSIKFSGEGLTVMGELPKVQLEINGKTVDCLDSTPCQISSSSKIYTDTLNRLNGLIRFKAMADCFACPTDIGNHCPCSPAFCQNAVLYTGYLLIYSGGSSLKITLIGTTSKCGGSYKNPFDPSALAEAKMERSKAHPPVHYELNGKKISRPRNPISHAVIRIK